MRDMLVSEATIDFLRKARIQLLMEVTCKNIRGFLGDTVSPLSFLTLVLSFVLFLFRNVRAFWKKERLEEYCGLFKGPPSLAKFPPNWCSDLGVFEMSHFSIPWVSHYCHGT